MTVLVFTILFGLSFVVFPCEGKTFLPPEGDTFLVVPGTDVKIAWTFDDKIDDLIFRVWRYTPDKVLATISADQAVNIKDSSPLPGIEIEKPSTLVLKNVDTRYNGTYEFQVGGKTTSSSYVTVIVAVVPIMTVCSSPITVDEDESVTCLCQGEGGQPPANVTWYKDGVQHGDTGDEKNILTLCNVDITAGGTYNCVGQSYTLKSEQSIQVIVRPNVLPTVTSFTSEKAVLGKSVTLTCEAEGRPSPSYTLIHNDTDQVSNEKTYKIDEVKYSHIGWYKCTAKNKLGNASIMYRLTVAEPANSSTKVDSGNVVVWHVVAALLSGLVIGFLFACIIVTVYFRRRYRKKKPSPAQSNPEPQSSNNVDSIYQDLDLNKMNEEENYQSLKAGNSGGQNESNYTELNLARDVEDNYQSLT